MNLKFKVGDKVKIVRGGYGISTDNVGLVTEIVGINKEKEVGNKYKYPYQFKVEGVGFDEYWEDYHRQHPYAAETAFELVEDVLVADELVEDGDNKPELFIEYNGVRLVFDPNVPASKQFVETIIETIYK